MSSSKKIKVFIIDSSAIFSGKPINIEDCKIFTTTSVSNEFQPGGRDFQNFQFMLEKGLMIQNPTKKSIEKITEVSKKTGDYERLSIADKEILALSLDKNDIYEVIILTDDYSIQNLANNLNIKYESISQEGIKKRFKWTYICQGCKKKFKENKKTCPICGSETKKVVLRKKELKKL